MAGYDCNVRAARLRWARGNSGRGPERRRSGGFQLHARGYAGMHRAWRMSRWSAMWNGWTLGQVRLWSFRRRDFDGRTGGNKYGWARKLWERNGWSTPDRGRHQQHELWRNGRDWRTQRGRRHDLGSNRGLAWRWWHELQAFSWVALPAAVRSRHRVLGDCTLGFCAP